MSLKEIVQGEEQREVRVELGRADKKYMVVMM